MITALTHIIESIKAGRTLSSKDIDIIVRDRNRLMHDKNRTVAKKRLMSRYLKERADNSDIWKSWDIDEETHRLVLSTLRAKPRRTASGVATITVLTKPWPCTSDCIYCPNDIRMPKSYLSDEPACQRAERNFFDPYLQVVSRLSVLEDMGHITDKVELIVLGGTWSDYPQSYRIWFARELFRALNDFDMRDENGRLIREVECENIREAYIKAGYASDPDVIKAYTDEAQALIDSGELSYNKACITLRDEKSESVLSELRGAPCESADKAFGLQQTQLRRLEDEQERNEGSMHRVVGLVFETRPDMIDEDELLSMRLLGATKVQMGIQSLDDDILAANRRHIDVSRIADSFQLLRLFGFKIHIHLMCNLVGATPESDIAQYKMLVKDKRFIPDEVKLYPCALVQSAHLTELHEKGKWHPYSEDTLIDVLSTDVLNTPAHIRISRMIRDISAKDILVGNKKTNLRQMVETEAHARTSEINEMRIREISTDETDASDLSMEIVEFDTLSSEEFFIQWVTPTSKLAGFLRLSLPKPEAIESLSLQEAKDAISPDDSYAMIREVHVYGKVSKLHESKEGNQHIGLGKTMIKAACDIAKDHGYKHINVISSVGTRLYYKKLGFVSRGLYQTKEL